MKDTVFTDPLSGGRPFTFDEKVAEVFPDMARRSIPGYELIINAIGRMAARHARDNSVIYDLGCSLGEASLVVRRAMPAGGRGQFRGHDPALLSDLLLLQLPGAGRGSAG